MILFFLAFPAQGTKKRKLKKKLFFGFSFFSIFFFLRTLGYSQMINAAIRRRFSSSKWLDGGGAEIYSTPTQKRRPRWWRRRWRRRRRRRRTSSRAPSIKKCGVLFFFFKQLQLRPKEKPRIVIRMKYNFKQKNTVKPQ